MKSTANGGCIIIRAFCFGVCEMANKNMTIASRDAVKKYLTTDDCAQFIGRSAGAVRNLVLRRAIPYRKPGGRLVFLKSELEAWIDQAPGKRIEEFFNG